MAKKKKVFTKATPQKLIQAYVLSRRDKMSNIDIAKKLGISGRSVTNWVRKVEKDPQLLEKAKAKFGKIVPEATVKKVLEAPKKRKYKNHKNKNLQNENDYLRWCLMGERNGYVDRMLNELGKGR